MWFTIWQSAKSIASDSWFANRGVAPTLVCWQEFFYRRFASNVGLGHRPCRGQAGRTPSDRQSWMQRVQWGWVKLFLRYSAIIHPDKSQWETLSEAQTSLLFFQDCRGESSEQISLAPEDKEHKGWREQALLSLSVPWAWDGVTEFNSILQFKGVWSDG